jgi:hypothetical protein
VDEFDYEMDGIQSNMKKKEKVSYYFSIDTLQECQTRQQSMSFISPRSIVYVHQNAVCCGRPLLG